MVASPSPRHLKGRKWIARVAASVLIGVLVLALLFVFKREEIRQTLADWTGEEDPVYQLNAIRYLAQSAFQPGHETADFASMPYTDLPPFGVNTFFEQEVEESKIRASMQLIHDAGFHFIRQEFPWEAIEQPARGQFWDVKYNHSTWQQYDLIVSLAQEYGLDIIARLDHPPNWTRHDGAARGNFAPPDNYDDYGDFVATVVSRYRGRIKFYQLWNEPNICCEWGNQPVNAADYVRLLKVGYTRAKEADPNAVIISAGLAPTKEVTSRDLSDLIFLQQMYDAGARAYFDVLAVQDYGLFTGPGDRRLWTDRMNFSRPILIRELMVKNGDANKPIWAMEVGWNTLPARFKEAPYGRVSEAQQAHYAVQAYARAQEEWPWMGPMMYWFFKRADDHEQDQPMYYFRMFDPDLTPHPVYAALKDYIAGARFLGPGFHQESDWALDYQGGWAIIPNARAAASAYKIGQPGDTLRFRFHGTELALVVAQNPYGGRVGVSVDGQPAREIDLRATDAGVNGRITVARGLSDGEHRVQVTVTRGELRLDGLIVRRTMDWLIQPLFWVIVLLAGIVLEWVVLQRLQGGLKSLELKRTWHRLRDSIEREAAADKHLDEAEVKQLLDLEKDGK